MDLVVRDLGPAERGAAVALLADAFADEPYVVDLHGPDREVRLAAVRARYAAEDPAQRTLRLGAYLDGALVGALLGSLPGTCHACTLASAADPWSRTVASIHSEQLPHGWAGRLGVDPAHRGLGAGAGLLLAGVARAREHGAVTLLECQAHRIPYYERRGFSVVARVPDPPGADGAVLRLDRSAASR